MIDDDNLGVRKWKLFDNMNGYSQSFVLELLREIGENDAVAHYWALIGKDEAENMLLRLCRGPVEADKVAELVAIVQKQADMRISHDT